MKMKIESRSHRYNINRPRSRHGHKHSRYEVSRYDDAYMYLGKQQCCLPKLSNTEAKLKKKALLLKKACMKTGWSMHVVVETELP